VQAVAEALKAQLRGLGFTWGDSRLGQLVARLLEEKGFTRCLDLCDQDSQLVKEATAAAKALGMLLLPLKRPPDPQPLAPTNAPKPAQYREAPRVAQPAAPEWIQASYITHGRIRSKILPTLQHGHSVRVRWAHKGDAGTWVGIVDRKSDKHQTLVHYSHFLCGACDEWHNFQDKLVFPLPNKDVVYYDIVQDGALPRHVPDCHPERDETTLDIMEDDGALHPGTDRVQPSARQALLASARDPRKVLGNLAVVERGELRGSVGRDWFIHHAQPPYVHDLTWKEVTEGTRTSQRTWIKRIKNMPADLYKVRLSTAIVELVLRYAEQREWKWSTISSHLSCVKAALNALPLYTSEAKGIDLKDDVIFAGACRNANKKAREHTTLQDLTKAITKDQFDAMAQQIKVPATHLLAQMCWAFAARVGDMAQVLNQDVVLKERRAADAESGQRTVAVTFRWGKGAAFWGPYTIITTLPLTTVKRLVAAKNAARPRDELFAPADQARLSKAIKQFEGCDLRSIRRGAIMHNANRGVSDNDLQLLTGHKRKDTLMRYLGWGVASSTAVSAAERRATAIGQFDSDDEDELQWDEEPDVTGGRTRSNPAGGSADGAPELLQSAQMLPPKMGVWSGVCGDQGRRRPKPEPFLPPKPASSMQLGIVTEDWRQWALHVKDVGLVSWDAIRRLSADEPQILALLTEAQGYVTSDEKYGINWEPLPPSKVPKSSFTPEQTKTMADFRKLEDHKGPIRSFANGFPIPQPSKIPPVQRPIFEPFINFVMSIENLIKLAFPSRLERRAQMAGARYGMEFDFSAFFDQIELHPDVRDCYVIKIRNTDGSYSFYRLTRLPMGVRFAVGVAQAITWAITAPIAHLASTCIDNVRITANSKAEFVTAVRLFLGRCDEANVTVNGRDSWRGLTDQEIAEKGRSWCKGPSVSLGEEFSGQTVRNSPKSIDKLKKAFELVKKPNSVTTRRKFAAIVGLIIFMAHTINVGLWHFFKLLRCYSRVCSPSSPQYSDVLWDEPMTLVPAVHECLTQAVEIMLRNSAVPIKPLLPPSQALEDYDTVIIVDASGAGWAAYVRQAGETKLLTQGWTSWQDHSAHAEPRAAAAALAWARKQRPLGHVAIVTDHEAMPKGQRRWWSGYCGFSPAEPLNRFYHELYGSDDLSAYRREVFFVEGTQNPADGPSRSVALGDQLKVRKSDKVFPALTAYAHPYLSRPERQPWQV
jgi:hypothetical protein